jgi:hypothetical protein
MLSNTNLTKIIWEKWNDPYGLDNETIIDYDNSDDEDYTNNNVKQNRILVTNMGIIPYNEYTDCSKIFNFWIGHTNFNLSTRVVSLIAAVTGVETLDVFTRYRFRVSFGKAFNDSDIIDNINQTVKTIFTENYDQ